MQWQETSSLVPALRSLLKERLPDYMIPSSFVLLEALPLTPSGKVNRRALPAPESGTRAIDETYVAPTRLAHSQMIGIWEEMLNVRPIGVKDNFFLLGGHSLLAAHLIERIEHIFHRRLSLSTLFAGPTVEQLVAALEEQVESGSQPVMAIQSTGARRPFFFLHGHAHGDGFFCYPLAHGLGTDQPFYAIPPYQFGSEGLPPTLEEIAAAHVAALRTVQPEGPYLLAGWCNGALTAYEMARQLHAQGEKIALLVLMDPMDLVPDSRLKFLDSVIDHLVRLLKQKPEKRLNWFLRLRHVNKYLRYPDYRQSKDIGPLVAAVQDKWSRRTSGRLLAHLEMLFPSLEALYKYLFIIEWVAMDYAPASTYPGKITFIWHRDESLDRGAWQKVIDTNEVEVHILPGTQKTLITDHLSDLANVLQACIHKAQSTDAK